MLWKWNTWCLIHLGTPRLKFSAFFVKGHRAGHGLLICCTPWASLCWWWAWWPCIDLHRLSKLCRPCVRRPRPSLITSSVQSDAHTQTCMCCIILELQSFWTLWICVHVFILCHCIAPPLNLEIQSMLKLDKKEQETMTNDVCFSGKWAENLDVPFTILRPSIKLVYGR